MIFTTLSLTWFMACSGSGTTSTEIESTEVAKSAILSSEELQQTWVFKASDATWRGQFEGEPGWTALFNRDYQTALSDSSGAGAVRMHAEFAAVYRQAALLHAHASQHAYGTDRQEEDGPDSLYLRGVSNVILGSYDQATADFDALTSETLKGYSEQWVAIAKQGGWTAESVIEGHFVSAPEVKKGAQFRPESVPHFEIATTIDGTVSTVTDATELWVRSKWHESMADMLAAEQQMDPAWVDVFLMPWITPMEANTQPNSEKVLDAVSTLEMDSAWLFLSRNLVSADSLFLYDLQFSTDVEKTLGTWSDRSLLAKVLKSAMVDGQLDVSKVLDAASELDALLVEEMKTVQGKEEPFYPMFADFAEQAVLIAGVMVAEKNGQRKDSGRLRINANDLALQNSKDALFLTEFAAYDVSNRYPMRAQDMLHRYRNDFRAFKVAGHPLGTLQIRLGRSAGVPGASN